MDTIWKLTHDNKNVPVITQLDTPNVANFSADSCIRQIGKIVVSRI